MRMKTNPQAWWTVPLIFDFSFKTAIPYIWFGWWLITWEDNWNKEKHNWAGDPIWKRISIDFQPD